MTLCIHDRTEQVKAMGIASPRPNFQGHRTAYENIYFCSFLSKKLTDHFSCNCVKLTFKYRFFKKLNMVQNMKEGQNRRKLICTIPY